MITALNMVACSVCFLGKSDPSAYTGLKLGVITLLAVIGFILLVITKFFIDVDKRSKSFANQV